VSAPLTSTAIQQALRSAEPAPRETPEHLPAPSAEEGAVRTISTAGGVVSARCRDQAPTLLYAIPADGYRTERRVMSGPAVVRFLGAAGAVTVSLTCRDDDLRADTRTDRVGVTPPSPAPTPTVRVTEPPRVEPSDRPDPSESAPPGEDPSSS
jgi:hypothetical protein